MKIWMPGVKVELCITKYCGSCPTSHSHSISLDLEKILYYLPVIKQFFWNKCYLPTILSALLEKQSVNPFLVILDCSSQLIIHFTWVLLQECVKDFYFVIETINLHLKDRKLGIKSSTNYIQWLYLYAEGCG